MGVGVAGHAEIVENGVNGFVAEAVTVGADHLFEFWKVSDQETHF